MHWISLSLWSQFYSFTQNWWNFDHETGWDKVSDSEVILGKDGIGQQYHDQWYFGNFFRHEVYNWGQQVACLILCPPFKMFFWDEVHGEQWLGKLEVWLGEWFYPPVIF